MRQAPAASGARRPPPAPRVAVVGAGFAGLAAAQTLKLQGISATVIEAGAEPGGRARTPVVGPGLALEIGATWLHGIGTPETPNPVFAAAVEFGLVPTEPQHQVWWEPQFLRAGASEPLGGADLLAAQLAATTYAEAADAVDGGRPGSLGDQVWEAWVKLESSGYLGERSALGACAWRWRECLQRVIDGCADSARLSARGSELYEEMGERHVPIPAGFQAVARRLAQCLDVRYCHEVLHLDWGPAGVNLRCTNGAELSADAAIVTVSLGVLKARAHDMFRPPLPRRMAEAIAALGIDPIAKLFVEFMPDDDTAANTTSTASSSGAAQAAAPASGNATDDADAVRSYALLWGAAPEAEAAAGLPDWARGIFSIRLGGPEVKAETGAAARPPAGVAVMWASGEEAMAMEQAPEAEVLAVLRQVFQLFPGVRLPAGASWGRARLHRSGWASDPRFLGGYAYIATGASEADVAALLQPVLGCSAAPGDPERPVVLLAGDACHPRYMGTTHGAYMSGHAQALRLAAALQQQGAAPVEHQA